jgi:hypothetical protein
MIREISHLNHSVFRNLGLSISDIIPDLECDGYFGFNFKINNQKIKFRKSKLTPKKTGQFVTFWKRDSDGKTVPFDVRDDFDFYIIWIEENQNSGFFIFPKNILEKENLISGRLKSGKRGFRIYADWHKTENKQAGKTQLWQSEYFISGSEKETEMPGKFDKIFSAKTS